VVLVEKYLTLEVAGFDEIAVDQAQIADTGADQGIGQYRAQGAATAQRHFRLQQSLLSVLADAGKAHLPAVALQGRFGNHASSPSPMPKFSKNSLKKRWCCLGHFS